MTPGPAALVAVAAGLTLLGCGGPAEQPAPPPSAARIAQPEAGARPETAGRTITLYFADDAGSLVAEERLLPDPPDGPEPLLRATLEALLAGPSGRLVAVIPPASTLRAAYLGADGTAYVDLDAAFQRGLSQGSEDALLAVWSIANTLAMSLPEVRRVRILVEGEEVRDLGGHLDLSRPVLPDMTQVAGGRR